MIFLHSSHIKVHANLKSSNVVIDGRWTCKLTDFGLMRFMEGQDDDPELSDHAKYSGNQLLSNTIMSCSILYINV